VPFDLVVMQENEADRRRDVRARVNLPTRVVRRGGDEPVEMLDASFRGLFLRTDAPPPERQLLKLVVSLPSRELVVHAVVVRIVVDALGRAGVGLRFFALNGQDRADWEGFINGVVHGRVKAA
jgi:hypothetical protein